MTIPVSLTTLLLLTVLAANVTVSVYVMRKARQTYRRSKLAELELVVSDLANECDSLRASFKKLNAKYAMAIAREKAKEQTDEDEPPPAQQSDTAQRKNESAAQWKERIRANYRFTPNGPVPR